jgi:hypothetical protein
MDSLKEALRPAPTDRRKRDPLYTAKGLRTGRVSRKRADYVDESGSTYEIITRVEDRNTGDVTVSLRTKLAPGALPPRCANRESVTLFGIRDEKEYVGDVEECFFGPRRRTGKITLRGFEPMGSVRDRRQYLKLIGVEKSDSEEEDDSD